MSRWNYYHNNNRYENDNNNRNQRNCKDENRPCDCPQEHCNNGPACEHDFHCRHAVISIMFLSLFISLCYNQRNSYQSFVDSYISCTIYSLITEVFYAISRKKRTNLIKQCNH